MEKVISFQSSHSSATDRIEEFCAWGEPNGYAEFNSNHVPDYKQDSPWFSFSPRLMPHSHSSSRSWLVKHEYLGQNGIFGRTRVGKPENIKVPEALIIGSHFLRFAKTFINLYIQISGIRSAPKTFVSALIVLEKALRNLNEGKNDPSLIGQNTFHQAERVLGYTDIRESTRAEIGQALEKLALMMQGGGRLLGSKRYRELIGFRLLTESFTFKSKFKSPPRYGKKEIQDSSIRSKGAERGQLNSEEVAAIGLAYQRALERTGPESFCTFVAAMVGLTMTTASMRASELQLLRCDALYTSEDQPQRVRLRIPRPKIGIEQDVPVPSKLAPLAQSFFDVLLQQSSEAREAFAFYIQQSPTNQAGIHTLYIPERFKTLFEPDYLNHEQIKAITDRESTSSTFQQRLADLPRVFFVKNPGDVYGSRPNMAFPLIQILHVVQCFKLFKVSHNIPIDAKETQYVSIKTATTFASGIGVTRLLFLLRNLFKTEHVRYCKLYIARDLIHKFLLDQFKSYIFPNWPYASKDRSVRLDQALAVCYASDINQAQAAGTQERCWWRPTLLSIQVLNRWIARRQRTQPLLFSLLDIKLSNGDFPSISVHRTRKYHHTSALLAGANSLFVDQLAGRQSGWQSEHYDFRTPQEIVQQSIDTFDPNEDFIVAGPLAVQAPPGTRILERRVFLAGNAAPRHVTEIGGCRSDWSLNPCYQHGDCMRCDSHVWRKGDQVRLPRITDIMQDAQRAIESGQAKLIVNPRMVSIEKQVRQLQETVQRCEEILLIEANPTVTVGTIVTFNSSPTAMTSAQLSSLLRTG